MPPKVILAEVLSHHDGEYEPVEVITMSTDELPSGARGVLLLFRGKIALRMDDENARLLIDDIQASMRGPLLSVEEVKVEGIVPGELIQ